MSSRHARQKAPKKTRQDAQVRMRALPKMRPWPLLEEALRATNLIGKAFFENPEEPPRGPSIAQRYFAAARALIAAGRNAEASTS